MFPLTLQHGATFQNLCRPIRLVHFFAAARIGTGAVRWSSSVASRGYATANWESPLQKRSLFAPFLPRVLVLLPLPCRDPFNFSRISHLGLVRLFSHSGLQLDSQQLGQKGIDANETLKELKKQSGDTVIRLDKLKDEPAKAGNVLELDKASHSENINDHISINRNVNNKKIYDNQHVDESVNKVVNEAANGKTNVNYNSNPASNLGQTKPGRSQLSKEQLLATASNVFSRLRIRLKWVLKKSNRPLNTDDYSALFSWLVVGNALILIVGTTTFVLLIIFTANTVFAQEFVARKLGEFMTKNSNLTVTFEHAIVPGWKDGKISFKKCFVSRRPKMVRSFKKSSQADAYAKSLDSSDSEVEPADDGNYTQFDLMLEEVTVSLSFLKWMNGTGIIDTMEISGLRGVVDRTHVHWDSNDDATNYKNKYQFGDFEFNEFSMKDILFTLKQPGNFRPFEVAIYNCELEKLRKHWLFYDFLNANIMSGSYDNSLFTVHKRQRLDDFDNSETGLDGDIPWKRITRLRVDSLNIDHLNRGLEGPFGWITSGKVDMTGDVMLPEDGKDFNVSELVSIVAESIHKEATRYRNPEVNDKKHNHVSRLTNENSTQISEVSKYLVLELSIRLKNVRALVPFQAPELNYVNYALIRPIVAYINLRNSLIEIKSRVVKNIEDFSGSWTIYDSLLMDDISEEVYDSFARYVADDETRLLRMRKVAFWSVQVLVQLVVFGLGALN